MKAACLSELMFTTWRYFNILPLALDTHAHQHPHAVLLLSLSFSLSFPLSRVFSCSSAPSTRPLSLSSSLLGRPLCVRTLPWRSPLCLFPAVLCFQKVKLSLTESRWLAGRIVCVITVISALCGQVRTASARTRACTRIVCLLLSFYPPLFFLFSPSSRSPDTLTIQ